MKIVSPTIYESNSYETYVHEAKLELANAMSASVQIQKLQSLHY